LHVYLTNIGICMDQKQTRSGMVTWGALVDLARNDPKYKKLTSLKLIVRTM